MLTELEPGTSVSERDVLRSDATTEAQKYYGAWSKYHANPTLPDFGTL